MTPYYDEDGITIYHGDALEVLGGLHVSEVDLVTFDPPYNVGKGYDGYADALPAHVYWAWINDLLYAMVGARTLTWFPGANNIGPALSRIEASSWRFRRLLAWHKKEYAGDVFHSGPAMCWEPIVWANHEDGGHHNRLFGAWGRDLLVVNSTHGDPLRQKHPCPKPPEVLRWLIGLFTPEDGLVLDPTMGTGTALLEARYLGRRAVGIEQSEAYCEVAIERLNQGVLALAAPCGQAPEQLPLTGRSAEPGPGASAGPDGAASTVAP